MFSARSMRNFRKDLFNHSNARNVQNTNQFEYNCAGFALGTFSWYLPTRTDEMWGDWFESDEAIAELTHECIQVMLEDFADLRIINDMSELGIGEYAIAFRLSADGDFHYMKQSFYKEWKHKTGWSDIHAISQEEVFTTNWCGGRYNGPLVLFAKKF